MENHNMSLKSIGSNLAVALVLAAATTAAKADVIFFSGDLRTDANVTACGSGCTLGPGNTDLEYANWAAVTYTFVVNTATTVQAITYGYAGGTSLTGTVVPSGGLEPYLSLFDSSGNLLASSFSGTCPATANTLGGNCFDVQLDTTPLLEPGTYTIALSAWENMSLAENLGTGTLTDGFTGLGNLNPGENLDYAFDVILPSNVPEPGTGLLLLTAFGAAAVLTLRNRFQQAKQERKQTHETT
jgi:hypothetical protein